MGGSPTHAPAIKIAPFSAPANRSEKRRRKTATAKLEVWLASISIFPEVVGKHPEGIFASN